MCYAETMRPTLRLRKSRSVTALGLLLLAASAAHGAGDWPEYGGDAGGQRYTTQTQITPENVGDLEVAWTWRHGDVSGGVSFRDPGRSEKKSEWATESAFELTPILSEGTLYGCTPMNRVFALDPENGAKRWIFDPQIPKDGRYANALVCRGVSAWTDPRRDEGAVCRRRIFTATADARLIALDAASGRKCPDFGVDGEVALKKDIRPERWLGEYQVTSAPTVVHDLVVVGSAVSDGVRVDAPSGVVRAFDARTGAVRWAWDLRPPDAPAPEDGSYTPGTPNVWAPMSADPEKDLLFVPTGNPSPDYYRGGIPQKDYYGSSLVALRASTGRVVWRFQTVHHDLWDYDVPAQPTLTRLRTGGREIDAVIQPTKMGLLFVLERVTGRPVWGVEERPVPGDGAPGEVLSPTQPYPVKPPPLLPTELGPGWGLTPFDRGACRKKMAALRYDGWYTPPTTQGSIMYPGNGGGSNWGGVAVDPGRQILVANVMDVAWVVTLIPRDQVERVQAVTHDAEIAPQAGTAYGMRREVLVSPLGVPCNPPPWGMLAAVDLASGDIKWQIPFGTTRDIAPIPIPWNLGVPNIGGPMVTASGLVFIGAAMDNYLRAYDVDTGEELWKGRLPAGGQATPMSYSVGGRQFVVIAAGGHSRAGTTLGDYVIAYALPE